MIGVGMAITFRMFIKTDCTIVRRQSQKWLSVGEIRQD